ncbi:MAG: ParB/RepB/Spo0J family partition protein [Anaeromyxobacteraceae bacterium]
MELEPRTAAPAHATGAVLFVPLSSVSDDGTLRLRDEGDVAPLAASIARLGQLVPVELRPLPQGDGGPVRYQIVSGFRRVAALKVLMRDRVLARIHARLDDEDAWAIALAHALVGEPLLASELEALKDRVAALPAAVWAAEAIDEAVLRAPVEPAQRERFLAWLASLVSAAPRGGAATLGMGGSRAPDEDETGEAAEVQAGSEGESVEMTPEELAEDLSTRMWELNQDLALAAEHWGDMSREARRLVLEQARWVAGLVKHLEGGR